MNRWIVAAAAAALVAPVVSLLARQDQKVVEPAKHFKTQRGPSALVLGRVVDATTNQPIANAVVSLGVRAQPTSSNVYTTDAGYFVFRDLPAGSYPLTVVASGYLSGGFGQRRPGGPTQPLSLAD